MNLLKHVEVEVARQLGAVFRVGLRLDVAARRLAAGSPHGCQVGAAEPGAVQQQTVAAAPVLPGAADAVGDGARRHVEGRRRSCGRCT